MSSDLRGVDKVKSKGWKYKSIGQDCVEIYGIKIKMALLLARESFEINFT